MKTLKHLFTALLLMFATVATAHDFEVDGIYYDIISSTNKTVEVTFDGNYSDEYRGNVVIPKNVTYNNETYNITSIRDFAFSGCTGLTNITIPNCVTSIGYEAFRGCTGLTNITIPNSVTSIGDNAFYGCSGLTNIVVDEGNSVYDSRDNCNAIIKTATNRLIAGCRNTVIPGSVTTIGESAFWGCTGLTNVTIPNSVTSIERRAFHGCTGLTNIVVDEGNSVYDSRDNCNAIIKTATNRLIAGCRNTIIPNSVTSIGSYAFSGCSSLTSVTIGNSVTSIGDYAFWGCTGLTSVTIPNSVTSIGNSAFLYCSGLTSITIPNSVTNIGGGTFYGCSGLTSIEIPGSVTTIGGEAFSGCTGLTSITIPNSVTSIGEWAFYGCTGLTSVTIGNSVTSIGDCAFKGCTGLTSITIPNSVTSIVGYAFSGCIGLKEVHISDLASWCGIDFKDDGSNPLYYAHNLYLNGELVTELVIPDGVNEIKQYAFYGCTGLTSIEIPNSVTSIGEWAFYGCSSLESVIIPNSVTSIGRYAFSRTAWYENQTDGVVYVSNVCYSYKGKMPANTSITIKDGTLVIAEFAFRGCSGLTSITIPNSVTSIGNYAFSGCKGLKTVVNFSNFVFTKGSSDDGYIAYYADNVYNAPNGSIEEDYIFGKPNEVNTLLYYLGNRNELNLPVDYKGENYVIRDNVFKNYTTLTSVTIPSSVTSIGNSAFSGCTGLTRVDIVDGVKSIGYSAFAGCSNLEELYISNTIESIADCAFKDCTNILEIKVGSKKAITCNENIFSKDVYNNALLYVPEGRKFAYEKTVPWNRFYIVETDFTDISGVKEQIAESKTVYDLQGRKVDNPTNGIYIVNGKKTFLK